MEVITSLEASIDNLQNLLIHMDLKAAQFSLRLKRCSQLAGDAKALLDEATDS